MRAGRPSQGKVCPAAPEATLSQQQAEDIVKAAASRIATRKVRQECTSEIPRSEQMKVETIGVAREVLPSNSSAQQPGIIAMQADQLRTVREKMMTSGQEFDSALGGAPKHVNSFGEIYTAAVTTDNGVAASLENPIVPWSQLGGINPEGKHVHQGAVMTYTPVTEGFESIGRNQVRITTAKLLKRERQLSEEPLDRVTANYTIETVLYIQFFACKDLNNEL